MTFREIHPGTASDVVISGGADHPGLVVALIAASAAGKSWVAKQLASAGAVRPIPSITDRPLRPGETNTSYDHIFVDKQTFDEYSREGQLAIRASLYGHRYGLPPIPAAPDPVLPSLVLLKDAVVAPFRQLYPCTKVYHLESLDSQHKLVELMEQRGQSAADIAERREVFMTEVERGRKLADRVFISPGHPEHVLGGIQSAIANDWEDHNTSCPLAD